MTRQRESIDDKLSKLPYNSIFTKANKSLGKTKKNDKVKKSMAGQLESLSSLDLHAYANRISWPASIVKGIIP